MTNRTFPATGKENEAMRTKTLIALIVLAAIVALIIAGFIFFPEALPDLMRRLHGG